MRLLVSFNFHGLFHKLFDCLIVPWLIRGSCRRLCPSEQLSDFIFNFLNLVFLLLFFIDDRLEGEPQLSFRAGIVFVSV